MEIDASQLVKSLTGDLNFVVSDIFGIPDAAFREHGASGLNLTLYEQTAALRPNLLEQEKLNRAKQSFKALCDSVPNLPIEAVRSISIAYASVSLAVEELAHDPSGDSTMKMLISATTTMGMAMGILAARSETEEAKRIAMEAVAAGNRAEIEAGVRSALGRHAVKTKLASDPKQDDKKRVYECWSEWQKQPGRYKTKAQFARDMREKFENLESQPVIERWCRTWEKES
jgi:hypothetical protein